MTELLLPLLFGIFIVSAMALDLGLLRRRGAKEVSTRAALGWTALWMTLAVTFGTGVLAVRGPETALQFFTAYLVEWSLSLDNVFAIAMVFSAFAVPRRLQHRALIYGVIGALVMRLVLIVLGVSAVERFEFLLPLFGGFLLFTAYRMARGGGDHADPANNRLIRFLRGRFRITEDFEGDRFSVVRQGVRWLTPLGLAVIAVEAMDLVFAVDSIPAVLAISKDPFVVFTSNAFAILGLRSLYFLLAEARERFSLLSYGLAFILAFVGVKLLLVPLHIHVPPAISLGVIALCVGGSISLSLLRTRTAR